MMNVEGQIPRISIIWLLLAQVTVIVPHLKRMPWWIFVIWLLCALWRLAMFRGETSYPGFILRSILVALGCIGIGVSFGGLGGLDIAVALLILSFSLKVVEVKNRRDLNLVFYLAFVVIATAFLFSQSIYLIVYQLLGIVFVLTGMVATQYSTRNRSPMKALKVTYSLVLQAIPLMIVFFLVFPRLEPFWQVPSMKSSASTGMSDTMQPGDISKLNRSDKLAFRVEFNGSLPARDQLYWRGMTLMNFDGRTWTRQNVEPKPNKRYPEYLLNEPLRYVVTMEPNQNHWLFTLPVVRSVEENKEPTLVALPNYTLASLQPFNKRRQISLESYLDTPLAVLESAEILEKAQKIPKGFNPRAIQLAQALALKSATTDQFVDELKTLIASGDYYYTLEPPKLGHHNIDEFLFETRRGFCEHYASAVVFLLRAAGIPARVVIGYQGGEVNALNNVLTIRQFDAHAWAEYWEAGSGWIRLDPTAFVAPSRILMGMQGALESDSNIEAPVFSSLYFRNLPLIKTLRVQLETLNIKWQNWFVHFDSNKQSHLLEKLLGDVTPMRTALLVLGVLITSFALATLVSLWRRNHSPLPIELLIYQRFLQKLAKIGMKRRPSETPGEFGHRAASAYPSLSAEIMAINSQFEAIVYAARNDRREIDRFKRLISRFRPEYLLKK